MPEKRYIDANILPDLFDEEYRKTWKLIKEGETHLNNLAEGFTEAHDVISRVPTEDVIPVVRKQVVGYEGYYEVDQFGRVFGVDRIIHVLDNRREYDKHLAGKQLKQGVHTAGYKTVDLTKNGVTKKMFVHRLVANAFIENPYNLPFVNHKDEDKTNNFVDNLEWCTNEYNVNYGTAIERAADKKRGVPHTQEHKDKCSKSLKKYYQTHKSKSIGRISEKRKPVYAYDMNGNFVAWYPSIANAAKETGVSNANITAVCNGKRKSAKKLIFSFCSYGERKDEK